MPQKMKYEPYTFDLDDAYRFARSQNAVTKEHNGELFFKSCPFCHSEKDHWTFSICISGGNAGTYHCFRESCMAKGNMIDLARTFDGFSLPQKYQEYYEPRPEKYRKFFQPPKPMVPTHPAIAYLNMRGISEDVAKKYELFTEYGKDNVLVFNFYDDKGQLRFVKYRRTDYIQGRDTGPKEWSEKDGMPILFGMKQCDTSSHTLIITEGQIDSLSVAEAGYNNAVSVPTGAKGFTWVSHCWDWVVSNFETIIVFGDHEKEHITLLDDLRKYFAKLNVKSVREEDYKDCKDANDILRKYGKEQVRKCIENAVNAPIPNVISLADVTRADNINAPKLRTGFKGLDKYLHGGLPFNGVTVISGKRGEGKSTLASQILLRAADQGYRCFAYSGEMGAAQFKTWMDLQVAGRQNIYANQNPLGYIDYTISEKNEKYITEWYRDRIDFFDIGSKYSGGDHDGLLKTCENEIIRNGAQVLLIDNLMTAMSLESSGGPDKYERQSAFVNQLASLASTYHCLAILVAHKRKNSFGGDENDEISGSADITNLAMVTLAYDRSSDIDDSDRLMRLTKNRLFGDLNTDGWIMHYDPASKRIYGDGDDVDFKVGWNRGSQADEDAEMVIWGDEFV